MKAVILSAGKGNRLLPYTNNTPKCLIEVGGMPILGHQLRALETCGIHDIAVVVGYLHEQIDEFLGGRYTVIVNEAYEATNSIFSLWLARPFAEGHDFIVVNGDIVFDAELLTPLLCCTSATAALVDPNALIRDGEMNVVVEAGKIIRFSKEIPASKASAQSLQITKFGSEDSKLLFERISGLVEAGAVDKFPAFAYDVVLRKSTMMPVVCKGGLWYDIDAIADLHMAREKFCGDI